MDYSFILALLGAVWLAAFTVYPAGGCNRIHLRNKKLLKLGSMEEKEFNKMILAELRRISGEVYNDMIIKEGIYTAAELANNKDCSGDYIVWELYNLKKKQYTVNIGSFSCSFKAEQVFYFVWKFETLCRVRQSEKIRFCFGNPDEIPINEKAMYLNKENKVITKKKKLIKYSNIVAVDAKHKEDVYFYSRGIWYYLTYQPSGKDYILNLVTTEGVKNELRKWDFTDRTKAVTPIYEALCDSLGINLEKKTEKFPLVYIASEAEQANYINTLMGFIAEVSDLLIKTEIERTLKRLEMLYRAANITPEPIEDKINAISEPSDERQEAKEASSEPNDRAATFDYIRLASILYLLCTPERVKCKAAPLNDMNNQIASKCQILNESIKPKIFRHETSVLPTPEPGKQLSGFCKRFQKPNTIRIRDGTGKNRHITKHSFAR